MKKCLVGLLLIALTSLPLRAQTISGVTARQVVATLSAANAACLATNCVSQEVGGYKTIYVQVTGTCGTCTLQFEANIDGTNWVSVNMLPLSGAATAVTSTAAVGVWYGTVIGARFRARISALTSGSFVVTLRTTL